MEAAKEYLTSNPGQLGRINYYLITYLTTTLILLHMGYPYGRSKGSAPEPSVQVLSGRERVFLMGFKLPATPDII